MQMARVVIVEDDKMNAKVFDAVLRKRGGFDVKITEDVQEVLDLARSGQADLVIMDVSLASSQLDGKPMNGLSISRLLKDDARTASIPVIIATAHAMKGDRERFLEQSKADDYVSKPIMDQKALIQKIKALIEKQA